MSKPVEEGFTYSKNAVELFFMISGFLTAHHYRDRIASMSPLAYVRKRYAKLIVPSVIVTLWALANAQAFLQSVPGSDAFVEPITPLRVILSMLMLNTGWVASYAETALPINSTMWFVDVLLLCYLLHYPLSRLAKNRSVYLCACTLMVLLGWVCLEHPPGLPFLWLIDGRGYATFFLGVLLYEFHDQAAERVRKGVSVVWGTLILGFLATRMVIGFEEVFGDVGSSSYVRYFEFVVAPGMLMCALNLPVASKVLEWRPLLWLGGPLGRDLLRAQQHHGGLLHHGQRVRYRRRLLLGPGLSGRCRQRHSLRLPVAVRRKAPEAPCRHTTGRVTTRPTDAFPPGAP